MAAGKQKKIGILTSGGDAPGMNAVIRAIVRTAQFNDIRTIGIMRGYDGLLEGEIEELNSRSVSDIIQQGGTMLYTARCDEMMTDEGRDRAAQVCKVLKLDALVVLGGDGSLRGAAELSERGVNVFGIPCTIDLDMACSEYTIGFDTAVNSGMKAINKIRDTSTSHERCSIVEVMGRNAGHIALWCSVAGGAEEVMIPEMHELDEDRIIQQILENRSKGKTHNLIVVAEGIGGSQKLAKNIEKVTGIETRATILGHLQRGGSPTAVDRMHASIMGYLAVNAIVEGATNQVVVYRNGKHGLIGLEEALNAKREFNHAMYDMIKILAI